MQQSFSNFPLHIKNATLLYKANPIKPKTKIPLYFSRIRNSGKTYEIYRKWFS